MPGPYIGASMPATLLVAALLTATQTQEYAASWKTVESSVRSRYYGARTNKEKMDRLLEKYGPTASAAKSRQEFSQAVNAMIDEFGDSHFDFATEEDQGFYFMDAIVRQENGRKMPHIGAWFNTTGGKAMVQYVLNGSNGDKAGLRKGDVVLTVDGEKFSPVSSLKARFGKESTLSVQRGTQVLEIKVTPEEANAVNLFIDASRTSPQVFKVGNKSIGYYRVWTMIDRKVADSMTNWVLRGPGQRTDAFILDLRDGFGGRPEYFYEPFFAPQIPIDWNIGGNTVNQITGYSKPMAVLTNGGTRSAKEVVSGIFKKSKRATLVGQPTKGDVLGTFPQALADWGYLEIPMVQLTLAGETLEKNPVKPDLAVDEKFTFEGKDSVIEAAKEFLAK